MPKYHLSERDRYSLRDQKRIVDGLLSEHRGEQLQRRASNVWARIVKTPTGGIPAYVSPDPGSAACELVWIDTSSELDVITAADDITVWNIGPKIKGSEYILAVRDPWSRWIGIPGPKSGLFEVAMSQTGGSQGNATTAPSWTYTVTDTDGVSLGTGYSPVSSGYWVRHLGQMAAATRGIASYNAAGDLKVLWCNEQQITEECT